jgi:hypothetical protein
MYKLTLLSFCLSTPFYPQGSHSAQWSYWSFLEYVSHVMHVFKFQLMPRMDEFYIWNALMQYCAHRQAGSKGLIMNMARAVTSPWLLLLCMENWQQWSVTGAGSRLQCYAFKSSAQTSGVCGGIVVEALRYKPEGLGFDSRWCHWNFSLT